jgi:hypothetical protein
MQELDVTWDRVIGVWWLLMWRSAVGIWALEMIAGFIGVAIRRKPPDDITGFLFFGGLAAITIWPIVIRMALRKQYQGFRIALISTMPPV